MQDYSQNNQIQGITGLGNPPKTETPIMLNSHQNQSFNPPVQSVNPPTDTKPIEQTSNLGDIKRMLFRNYDLWLINLTLVQKKNLKPTL